MPQCPGAPGRDVRPACVARAGSRLSPPGESGYRVSVRHEDRLPSVAALFLPPPWSLALVGLTAAWIVLASGCTAVSLQDPGLFTLLVGVFVMPAGAALCFVAALLGRTAAARAVLHGTTALLLALGALLLALNGFERGFDPGSLLISILLYAAPIALAGTLALYYGTRAATEVEERVEERRGERLRRELLRRGEASFEELAAASGVAEADVDAVLDRLQGEQRIEVVLDTTTRRAFTARAFAGKEAALQEITHRQGRAAIYDVARRLGLSEARLREVLIGALGHGRFSGYVDWRRGIVFSADAERLREGRACPDCGGPMDLGGRGVIVCPYCGTEVLLQ